MAFQSWSIKILSTKWLEFSRGVRINMAGTVARANIKLKEANRHATTHNTRSKDVEASSQGINESG